MRYVQNDLQPTIVEGVPYLPEELQVAVANIDDPARARAHDRRLAAA